MERLRATSVNTKHTAQVVSQNQKVPPTRVTRRNGSLQAAEQSTSLQPRDGLVNEPRPLGDFLPFPTEDLLGNLREFIVECPRKTCLI
jgi:hypothetical protein